MSADFSWGGLPGGYTPTPHDAADFSWPPADVVRIKRWNGTSWSVGILKRWDGSTWEFVSNAQFVAYGGRAWVLPPA
jgi:hypothetical protein